MELLELTTQSSPIILSYRQCLSSSGHSPIVMIHGRSSSSTVFASLALSLEKFNHSLLMYDLPSHGTSPTATWGEGQHVDHLVGSLKAFLEYWNIGEERPCVLIGHAEGAFIVTSFAASFPLWTSELILINPILPPLSAEDESRLRLYRTLASERSPFELAKSVVNISISLGPGEEEAEGILKEKVLSMIASALPPTNQGFLDMCKMMETSPAPNYKRLTNVRALVIFGTQDTATSRRAMHALAAELKGTPLTHLKDDIKVMWHYGKEVLEEKRWERETKVVEMQGGHWLPLEQPEKVGEVIEQFLTE